MLFQSTLLAPKNKIYISLGLIARSQTEDQLAGIIAHEIAHLTQEHSKIQTERIKSLLVKVNLLNQILGLLDFHSESILSNSLFLVDKFILNLYQRQHEIEADAIAVKNLQRASWRVEEFSKFFEIKLPKGKVSKLQEYRIKELKEHGFTTEVYRG